MPPQISEYLFQANNNDDYIASEEIVMEDFGAPPSKVPLVMRMLLEEAENNMPQLSQPSKDNSQFKALARSILPTVFEQGLIIKIYYTDAIGISNKHVLSNIASFCY